MSPSSLFPVLALASLLVAPLPAEPLPAPSAPADLPPLTLEETVARALSLNYELEIQRFASLNAVEDVGIAQASFDPTFQLSASNTFNQSVSSQVVNSEGILLPNPGNRSETFNTRLGVSRRISSGATMGASTRLDRNDRDPAGAALNPAYTSDVSLTIRQPLLRNAGSTVTLASLERARLGVERAELDFRRNVLALIRNVEAAYYNLAFARGQLDVRAFTLSVSEKLLEENRARRDTGVATDLDVLQAEVGVANARRNLLLSQQSVRDREDSLLQLIDREALDQALGPVELGPDPEIALSVERTHARVRDSQPELASARLLVDQLRLDSDAARRNRLPDLSVGAALGFNGRDSSFSRSTGEALEGDGYSWQLDFTLTVPWGLRAENARYRQSLNALSREQLRLLQLDQDVLVQVRAAVRAVETNVESLRLATLSANLNERQFELEKARYDSGLSTFRRVQESQQELDTARVNELQARVNLRIALADLARLEGTSLDHYQITLAD